MTTVKYLCSAPDLTLQSANEGSWARYLEEAKRTLERTVCRRHHRITKDFDLTNSKGRGYMEVKSTLFLAINIIFLVSLSGRWRQYELSLVSICPAGVRECAGGAPAPSTRNIELLQHLRADCTQRKTLGNRLIFSFFLRTHYGPQQEICGATGSGQSQILYRV